MNIDFKYDEIKEKELRHKIPYAGFFTPNGDLINLNNDFGGETHDSPYNPVAQTYLKYISYIITGEIKDGKYANYLKEHNPEKLKEMLDDDINELIYRGYNSYYSGKQIPFENFYDSILLDLALCEDQIKRNEAFKYDYFKLDLLKLFRDAYHDGNYIKSVGKLTRIDSQKEIEERIKKDYSIDEDDKYTFERTLERAVNKEMLSGFKDICVEYLGYDTIERFDQKGVKIAIPQNDDEYDNMFYSIPRVITSSYQDIYERYYNYLLMDWSIIKVPRYLYNERTGLFEEREELLNPHREEKNEEIKEEIQSIKKLIPPKDRKQFFK